MNRKMRILGHFAIGIVAIALFGLVVMLLWNWLLPSIFGIVAINFWQAIGILLLSKILFGGFGFGRRHFGHKHELHGRLREKWMKMSEEERKEFLKHRRHFCFGHPYFREEETEKID